MNMVWRTDAGIIPIVEKTPLYARGRIIDARIDGYVHTKAGREPNSVSFEAIDDNGRYKIHYYICQGPDELRAPELEIPLKEFEKTVGDAVYYRETDWDILKPYVLAGKKCPYSPELEDIPPIFSIRNGSILVYSGLGPIVGVGLMAVVPAKKVEKFDERKEFARRFWYVGRILDAPDTTDVDKDIRDAIVSFNRVPFAFTGWSCSGSPKDHKVTEMTKGASFGSAIMFAYDTAHPKAQQFIGELSDFVGEELKPGSDGFVRMEMLLQSTGNVGADQHALEEKIAKLCKLLARYAE